MVGFNESKRPNVQRQQPIGSNKTFFSPKAVASAIGVSESSLKRWCDAGMIEASKTAGGHRRMTKASVVEFVRKKKYRLCKPEYVGLPDINTVSIENATDATNQLYNAMLAHDQVRCSELLTFLHVDGYSIHEVFDAVVSPAFVRVGQKWQAGEIEVYQERMACEICLNSIRELKSLIPAPPEEAQIAIGASLENDHYQLPTAAVELTLRSIGWNARSLGHNIPQPSIAAAVAEFKPDLVWVSVSHAENVPQVVGTINTLTDGLQNPTTLVVGGSALNPVIRSQIRNAVCCDNLSQLVSYAMSITKRRELNPNPGFNTTQN